jgi:hypothetical protein
MDADATSEEVAELQYELANLLIANQPDLIGFCRARGVGLRMQP